MEAAPGITSADVLSEVDERVRTNIMMRIRAGASEIGERFGRRVRELREARRLTQHQLAKLLLKSVETVSNFERGKMLPSLRTMAGLASTLGVELKALFEFDEETRADADATRLTHRMLRLGFRRPRQHAQHD
jgi:transcriptional regulator with XRE-family HTH domain